MYVKFGIAVEIENDEIETRTEIWTSFHLKIKTESTGPAERIDYRGRFASLFLSLSFSGLPLYRYNDR